MSMPPSTRYVVLEWPDGGGSPDVADTTAFGSLYDADDTARSLRQSAKDRGSRATFTVHAVNMDAEEL